MALIIPLGKSISAKRLLPAEKTFTGNDEPPPVCTNSIIL